MFQAATCLRVHRDPRLSKHIEPIFRHRPGPPVHLDARPLVTTNLFVVSVGKPARGKRAFLVLARIAFFVSSNEKESRKLRSHRERSC